MSYIMPGPVELIIRLIKAMTPQARRDWKIEQYKHLEDLREISKDG